MKTIKHIDGETVTFEDGTTMTITGQMVWTLNGQPEKIRRGDLKPGDVISGGNVIRK